MWDNINLLINKKQPSSHTEKLQVNNKRYEQPLTISNCLSEPINLQYLYFKLILGDFAPALLEVSFGTIFRNPLETNHLKKCLEKHFCAGTLLNTNETLSLL